MSHDAASRPSPDRLIKRRRPERRRPVSKPRSLRMDRSGGRTALRSTSRDLRDPGRRMLGGKGASQTRGVLGGCEGTGSSTWGVLGRGCWGDHGQLGGCWEDAERTGPSQAQGMLEEPPQAHAEHSCVPSTELRFFPAGPLGPPAWILLLCWGLAARYTGKWGLLGGRGA